MLNGLTQSVRNRTRCRTMTVSALSIAESPDPHCVEPRLSNLMLMLGGETPDRIKSSTKPCPNQPSAHQRCRGQTLGHRYSNLVGFCRRRGSVGQGFPPPIVLMGGWGALPQAFTMGHKSMKDRTTYIYFIQAGYGSIKVGMAKSPKKRLIALQGANSKPLRLLAAFPMPDRQSARNLEQDLHKAFEHERIRGEWFNRRIVRIGKMKKIFGGTLKQPQLRENASLVCPDTT